MGNVPRDWGVSELNDQSFGYKKSRSKIVEEFKFTVNDRKNSEKIWMKKKKKNSTT